MIRYLKGPVLDSTSETVTVLVGSLGLEVWVPTNIAETVEVGQELTLHTSFVVRQDAFMLFGFATLLQRQFFEMLVQVSGIGPKLALKTLSFLTIGELARALAEEAPGVLESVPGIGKKTAKRLVVELSEKVNKLGVHSSDTPITKGNPEIEECVEILRSFGCSDGEVRPIVERLYLQDASLDTDKLVLAVLAELGEAMP